MAGAPCSCFGPPLTCPRAPHGSRTGSEFKGSESTARDPIPRDPSPRDPSPADPSPADPSPRDLSPRNPSPRTCSKSTGLARAAGGHPPPARVHRMPGDSSALEGRLGREGVSEGGRQGLPGRDLYAWRLARASEETAPQPPQLGRLPAARTQRVCRFEGQ